MNITKELNRVEKGVIKSGLNYADRIVCLSPDWILKFEGICSIEKTTVIPNCIKLNVNHKLFFSNKKTSPIKKVLFLGDLIERKGIINSYSKQ